ncbi:MAG: hypothetical protein ACI4B6_02325, partial [Atopobiaceae bacterium]
NPGNRATPEKQSALLERATASNRKNPPATESAGVDVKATVRRAEDVARQNRKLVYVGFESALDFWRGDTRLGMYEDCIDPDGELSYCDGFDSDCAASSLSANDGISRLGDAYPIDLMVGVDATHEARGVKVHRLRANLPSRSFVRGRGNVRVASPELVFLQMAASYSLVELLKLGMELCGTYALSAANSDGFVPRRRICSVGRIKRFLSWCERNPGIKKARVAANMLMDGSNSPLESKVMLGLTMPPRYGGLGIRKPVLNQMRKTTWLQAETIGEHEYFYDARWSGTLPSGQRYSIDCEVDSNAHFNDPSKARSDVERKDNIQFMQTTHISITSEELYDAEKFARKGLMIAKHIGQRVRRYPRRGTREEQDRFRDQWNQRLGNLARLLDWLAHDSHSPRLWR